ncbi:unnamed protein product [Allacma fusca]|uniref:Uncharacterized protein n=1 Tax=Allacma fusca TaxID=39272 RepID=A0A8J2LH35_9HEXA|nr:unnamed protein product [Allacma fusca]
MDKVKEMTLNFTTAGSERNKIYKNKKQEFTQEESSALQPEASASVSEPEASASVSEPVDSPAGLEEEVVVPWWKDWFRDSAVEDSDQIVAFDCEHAHYKNLVKDKKKASSVAVVDMKGRVLYQSNVSHNSDDIHFTRKGSAISGIYRGNVRFGLKMEDVCAKVGKCFKDKVIIHCAGATDFLSLGLKPGEYNNFDLQTYSKEPRINEHGVHVINQISLKRIAKTYFIKDF